MLILGFAHTGIVASPIIVALVLAFYSANVFLKILDRADIFDCH